MKIECINNGNEYELKLEGRLDTMTAPDLDAKIKEIQDAKKITFDLLSLEYISSAGLRVVLATQKMMNKNNGSLIIKNVNDSVMEVFEITGFIDILTIE